MWFKKRVISISRMLTLFSLVYALPRGAPKCQINPTVIQRGHESAPNPALGYTLTAIPGSTPNSLQVMIGNSGAQPAMTGLLMYIAPASNPTKHLGAFVMPPGFRAQSAAPCQAGNIQQNTLDATVTHANPSVKDLNVPFVWQGTAQDLATPDLTLFTVISAVRGEAPRWQLAQLALNNGGGAAQQAPQQAPQQVPQQIPQQVPQQVPQQIPQAPQQTGGNGGKGGKNCGGNAGNAGGEGGGNGGAAAEGAGGEEDDD
ncbi:hypothetical protein EDD86DRAFT_112473 [Gorgonomyces haynaldii]|nr:hypothetical protein EDD86DRAFT_112473 [Gorgonomyces haynaldii]